MTNISVLGCILLLAGLAASAAHAEETLPKGIIKLNGQSAPPLALKNLDGELYDLAKSRGKWAFVHFWASWCGPCRKEMPTIQNIATTFKDSNLDIVLINTAEDEDTIFNFMGIVAPDLDTLMDVDGLVTEHWKPRALPETYLVDDKGRLRYMVFGGRPWDQPEYIDFLKRISQN